MNIGDIIDANQKNATNACPTAMVNMSDENNQGSKRDSNPERSPGMQHRTQIYKTYQLQNQQFSEHDNKPKMPANKTASASGIVGQGIIKGSRIQSGRGELSS
jgi:hypothetical protein